ncbi:hypothetical protein LDENG_00093670 [Lucifuga dentata]|nr:hypothetical protein LDENG_00093670 [Lucifuga dentata]
MKCVTNKKAKAKKAEAKREPARRTHGCHSRSKTWFLIKFCLHNMCDEKNGRACDKMSNADDLSDNLSASDNSEAEEQFEPELKDSSSSDEDDDGEVQISAAPAGLKAQSAFSLKGGSSGFSSRSHSIFECLDSVAKQTSSSLGQDNVIDGVFARPLPPAASGKSSQPRVSSSRPAEKRPAPDYLLHPERWTHYSLEDVAETSDHDNSRAALHFLSSLRQSKQEPSSSPEKILFSRPNRLGPKQPADEPSASKGRETEMHLSHLQEEEDEEEEGRKRRKMDGWKEEHVGKAKEMAKSAGHIDEDKEKEGKRAAMEQADTEDVGRKWEQRGRDVEKEEEEKKQVNSCFTSFKKTKHKNYRKNSEQDDH